MKWLGKEGQRCPQACRGKDLHQKTVHLLFSLALKEHSLIVVEHIEPEFIIHMLTS